MHPTVLIVAVLLLHGVSGHLFPRALPYKLTKQLPEYRADADADDCVDKRLLEAIRDETLPSICVTDELEAAIIDDDDDDDDDLNQEEFNAFFSWFCRPECGNFYLSIADDCGEFEEDDVLSRDVFIGQCGTNENGDKCYESFVDTLNNTLLSELDCYIDYADDKQCNCRSTLRAEVGEKGCCLDLYNRVFEDDDDEFERSELYDACDVDLPSGCNNSPIGSGFMPQVALVTLISALIFSVVFS